MAFGRQGIMRRKKRKGRKQSKQQRSFVDTKWLPLTLGAVCVAAGVALIEFLRPNPLGISVVFLGLLLGMEYSMVRVIGAMGPRHRQEKIESAYWGRALAWRRYKVAFALAALNAAAFLTFSANDWTLALMIVLGTGYSVLSFNDVVNCRREAGGLVRRPVP